MPTANFFDRLQDYFRRVSAVLQGEAAAASIFPNPSDVGASRERIYAAVLQQHLPANCRVFFGGFLFDHVGCESKQIDILVTSNASLQFNLHNQDGSGKSFASVEGCIAAVSVKSNLTTAELENALVNLASIPQQPNVSGRVSPMFQLDDYEDWPL